MKKYITVLFFGIVIFALCGYGVSGGSIERTPINISVNASGYGEGLIHINETLSKIWLNPGLNGTEVYIGTDQVGFVIWEDEIVNCWLYPKILDVFVQTQTKENFDIRGRFHNSTENVTLCFVNTSLNRIE